MFKYIENLKTYFNLLMEHKNDYRRLDFNNFLTLRTLEYHDLRTIHGYVYTRVLREEWRADNLDLWLERCAKFGVEYADSALPIPNSPAETAAFEIWRRERETGHTVAFMGGLLELEELRRAVSGLADRALRAQKRGEQAWARVQTERRDER